MTDDQAAPAADIPEVEITFRGRAMWVRMPSAEQLLVWKRTVVKLQGVDPAEGWNAEQVMIALERLRMIIDSVLVNRTDVEWLDDEMLGGNLGLRECGPIITLTVEAFADAAEGEGNRETKRAAKKAVPAKKAARKKVTTA